MNVSTNIYPLTLNLHPEVPVRFDMGADLKGVIIANNSLLSLTVSLPNDTEDLILPQHVKSYIGDRYTPGQVSILPSGYTIKSERSALVVVGIKEL